MCLVTAYRQLESTQERLSLCVQASQSHELSRLQSLLQIQSRAAALMLVKEDPGILELSPAFIMQRLVDLKVRKLSAPLAITEHTVTVCADLTVLSNPDVLPCLQTFQLEGR